MTPEDARAHYNFLLTLCIRKAESFGPLAFTFIKDRSFVETGLTPDEQFNLLMATTDAFTDEPKRYGHKLDCLQKAVDLLPKTHCYLVEYPFVVPSTVTARIQESHITLGHVLCELIEEQLLGKAS